MVEQDGGGDPRLRIAFPGPSDAYVRRDLIIPLSRNTRVRRKTGKRD